MALKVVITGRSKDKLEAVVKELGKNCLPMACDVQKVQKVKN